MRNLGDEPKEGNLLALLFGVAEQTVRGIESNTGLSGLWDAGKHLANEAISEFGMEHPKVMGVAGRLLAANMHKVMNASTPPVQQVEDGKK